MEHEVVVEATERGVRAVTVRVPQGARTKALELLGDYLPAIQSLSGRIVARANAPDCGEPRRGLEGAHEGIGLLRHVRNIYLAMVGITSKDSGLRFSLLQAPVFPEILQAVQESF